MSEHTYRVIEIVGTSPDGIDTAIRNGISRAARTTRNLDWFEVASVRGEIEDGAVAHFQVSPEGRLPHRGLTGANPQQLVRISNFAVPGVREVPSSKVPSADPEMVTVSLRISAFALPKVAVENPPVKPSRPVSCTDSGVTSPPVCTCAVNPEGLLLGLDEPDPPGLVARDRRLLAERLPVDGHARGVHAECRRAGRAPREQHCGGEQGGDRRRSPGRPTITTDVRALARRALGRFHAAGYPPA